VQRPDDEPTPGADDPLSPRPADRLKARLEATDRAARFTMRLDDVERARERRRRVRIGVRIVWAVLFAGLGALTPIVVAAVTAAADPTGVTLVVAAVIGGVVGALGPTAREWVASRRGTHAWDAYHERHVLLGDPSARVHDADRPRHAGGGPPPGGRR
jgi:hypothetical protein